MVKAVKKATRKDSILSPEELEKAINEYKAKRAAASAKTDEGEEGAKKVEPAAAEPTVAEPAVKEPVTPVTKIDEDTVEKPEEQTPENMVEFVKARRDVRDENGDPEDKEEAMGVIAHQDEDIDTLLDIIDSLLAERDFKKDEGTEGEEGQEPVGNAPAEGEEGKVDGEGEEPVVAMPNEEDKKALEGDKNIDGEGCEEEGKLNADSVDYIVRERVRVGLVGSKLNLDGLENYNLRTAKKKIINAVRPSINLDGKSASYIDAMFDAAVDEINSRGKNSVATQKKQMFTKQVNHDSKNDDSALSARERMIARQFKKEEK